MHFCNDPTPERGWGWTGDKEWLVHPLQILCALLALFPVYSFSQELVEFQNGEVADAQDINSNFNVLQDQILSKPPTFVSDDIFIFTYPITARTQKLRSSFFTLI